MKKVVSLVLATVMCLALSVSAFATNNTVREVDSFEVNGATVKVFVGPATENLTRGALPPIYGTATSTSSPITFAFDEDEGDFSDVRVWNESSSTDMRVTFLVTIRNNGRTDTVTRTEEVEPSERAFVQVTSNSGDGLRGSVKTTIRPIGANSVDYLYLAEQRWA